MAGSLVEAKGDFVHLTLFPSLCLISNIKKQAPKPKNPPKRPPKQIRLSTSRPNLAHSHNDSHAEYHAIMLKP